MSVLAEEIAEQPEVLARALIQAQPAVEAAANAVATFAPDSVVIAARGSSDNAARYAQYLFGALNRLVVALATPSLVTLYHQPPNFAGKLVIGISQSGRSPDIVGVIAEARQQGALTLAITNDPSSPLAASAAHVLPLYAGPERALPATKTYTAQLLVLAMLSAALSGDQTRWNALRQVPALVQETLMRNTIIAQRVERFRYADRFAVIGRGFNYATAFEIALKVKETSYAIAEPYSSADFRHGPIALIEPGFPVVLVAPSGLVFADMAALAHELAALRAELIVISDDAALLERAGTPLPLPTGVPEWLSPLVAVIPGQLFALHLALLRGLDPDQPRGLRKVTETR